MNDVFIYFLIGLAGGTLGGMGMGGGTVLIPLLSLFTSLHQKSSQAINLISLIPMAVVALYLHYKNGLIKKQGLLLVIIPACLFAVGGSLLCIIIDVKVLRRIFGGFLIALSVLQFFADKITKKTQKQ